tara:strand:+ start:333 stop:536 length:204 start_codon:yes stop_codon:yes gene_type:complete
MGNMSYCRFENTARDLNDCLYAIHNGEVEDLSSYEINGLKSILEIAKEIVEMEDDINNTLEEAENNA